MAGVLDQSTGANEDSKDRTASLSKISAKFVIITPSIPLFNFKSNAPVSTNPGGSLSPCSKDLKTLVGGMHITLGLRKVKLSTPAPNDCYLILSKSCRVSSRIDVFTTKLTTEIVMETERSMRALRNTTISLHGPFTLN